MTRQAHFEGDLIPTANTWRFSPDPAKTAYGSPIMIEARTSAAPSGFTLQSNLDSLRPDLNPPFAEYGLRAAPELADGLIEAPIEMVLKTGANEASGATADRLNAMRQAYIQARRQERATAPVK
jgi:hypothetical protein